MATEQPEKSAEVGRRWLKQLTFLRDILLASAVLLYISGYTVWSINAYQKHLGLLPAVQVEYFVAGFVPLVILIAAILLSWYIWTLPQRIHSALTIPITRNAFIFLRITLPTYRTAYFVIIGWIVLEFSSLLIYLIKGRDVWIHPVVTNFSFPLAGLSALLFLIGFSLALHRGTLELYSPPHRIWDFTIRGELRRHRPPLAIFPEATLSLMNIMYIVAIAAIGIAFYVIVVYPNLDSALGGLRPRCAYVDVAKDSLSATTLQDIGASDIAPDTQKAVRSGKLDVLYYAGDIMIVSPKDGSSGTYQLRKEAVQSIKWCEE